MPRSIASVLAMLACACDAHGSTMFADAESGAGPDSHDAGPASHGDADASAEAEGGSAGPGSDPSGDVDDDGSDEGPVGCPDDGSVAAPFGLHAHGYAQGVTLPNGWTQAQLDDEVRAFYQRWKDAYLEPGCGDDRYYVAIGSDNLTVSEAHGYGMIIAVYMAGHDPDARAIFDGLYRYYADHPSSGHPDLMAWSQDYECTSNEGSSSATDGDLDIAYALLLADRQWGTGGSIAYLAEADRIARAILEAEVDENATYMRLGDWTDPGNPDYYGATRPSDFMPSHFASFAACLDDDAWLSIADGSYAILGEVQAQHAPATGLLPDFVVDAASTPAPAWADFLERPVDGAYSFNACRVPWRIGLDAALGGDPRAFAMLAPLTEWARGTTGGDPWSLQAGYWLDGDPLPDSGYTSLAFVAPLGVAAMAHPDAMPWLNAVWSTIVSYEEPINYYDDTLALLSLLAMSGNWWAPEQVPCG